MLDSEETDLHVMARNNTWWYVIARNGNIMHSCCTELKLKRFPYTLLKGILQKTLLPISSKDVL